MEILELQLHHAYFPDGFLEHVKIVPNKGTEIFLNRYRILIKVLHDKFVLIYNGKLKLDHFLSSLGELMNGMPLVFEVIYQGIGFNIISGVPLDFCGLLKFSNRRTNSDKNSAVEKSMDITFETGRLTSSYSDFMIVIYPDDLKSDLLNGLTKYTLNISSRKTIWTYNIQNKGKIQNSNLKIKNSKNELFEQNNLLRIKNGEEFRVFNVGVDMMQSNYKINEKFSLITSMNTGSENSNDITKTLISELPTPSIDNFVIKEVDGEKQAYSDMFVYF